MPALEQSPHRATIARMDATGPNSRALKADPLLWNNEVVALRLGRDRDNMDPRQAAQLMGRLQQQGAVRERQAEEAIKAQFNIKNMSNIDEVVFGRDMDGSSAVLDYAGDEEEVSRKGGDMWNINQRSEMAEITFGRAPPTEEMAAFARANRSEIPRTMQRTDSSYSPTKSSLIGTVVFNSGDDSRMGGRLGDGEADVPDAETRHQLHAAIIDGTGTKAYRREAMDLRARGRSSDISFGGDHTLPGQTLGANPEGLLSDGEGRRAHRRPVCAPPSPPPPLASAAARL